MSPYWTLSPVRAGPRASSTATVSSTAWHRASTKERFGGEGLYSTSLRRHQGSGRDGCFSDQVPEMRPELRAWENRQLRGWVGGTEGKVRALGKEGEPEGRLQEMKTKKWGEQVVLAPGRAQNMGQEPQPLSSNMGRTVGSDTSPATVCSGTTSHRQLQSRGPSAPPGPFSAAPAPATWGWKRSPGASRKRVVGAALSGGPECPPDPPHPRRGWQGTAPAAG